MLRFAPVASLLRLPTLGYTFVSPFRSVRFRAGVLRFAPVASFAPAHVALRAAFGSLPSGFPSRLGRVKPFALRFGSTFKLLVDLRCSL